MATADERFMERALELARSVPNTSPNPRVGAVIVRSSEIVSEGFHRGPGLPHAEAEALKKADARGATVYLNLEPCSHVGSTPPCAPALVAAGVARVVVAIEDPDQRVSGTGLQYLRDHGVEVTTGVGRRPAELLNAPFLHHRRTGSSYVSLKLALTLDGRLTAPDASSRWITGEGARRIVHERRLEADAVLVGSGTILADDPRLTVRDVPAERQPLRIVLDGRGRTPASARVFSDEGVLMVTSDRCSHEVQTRWKGAGAEVIVLPEGEAGIDLDELVAELGRRGLLEVLCEGGATLATRLLAAELVDRLEVHLGAKIVGRGGADIGDVGVVNMARARAFSLVGAEPAGDDVIATYVRPG